MDAESIIIKRSPFVDSVGVEVADDNVLEDSFCSRDAGFRDGDLVAVLLVDDDGAAVWADDDQR